MAAQATTTKVDLTSMTQIQLSAWVCEQFGESHGADEAAALRLYKGIWQGGASSVNAISSVRGDLRQAIADRGYLHRLETELVLDSEDGTRKYLWKLEGAMNIESVLIPEEKRTTLCISSQVGCAMACTFCLTGDLGLKRHLSVAEIAGQVLQVMDDVRDQTRITNIVLMGMGEPMHNLKNLIPALEIMLDDHALNFSHRKITVSTVGLIPGLAKLANALPVNLAVSLNATTEEQRRQIMPITRKYSMAQLLQACREVKLPQNKRITFEYVMFEGFNDTLDDADRLVQLLQDIPSKINLIPYNENPARNLKPPSPGVVDGFRQRLMDQGMSTSVRTTRGLDISAACGQLGLARNQAAAWGTA